MKTIVLAAALAATLTGLAQGQAHAADALHLRCNNFVYFVGDGAPSPGDYVDVDLVDPNVNTWSIVYHLANGETHSRNDQYDVVDRSKAGDKAIVWGGNFHKRPKLYMVGAVWIDAANNNQVTYSEKLFDRSLGDKLVMSQSAACGPNPNYARPVTAQAPAAPQAHAPTMLGPDVVGLVSNGKAAAVKVYLGAHAQTMLIDTGAALMSLTPDVAAELVQAGEAHYTGQTLQVTMADGVAHGEQELIVERMTIGRHTLDNVQASIAPAGSMMLLPFPVLSQMGKFSIDTRNNLLTFGD